MRYIKEYLTRPYPQLDMRWWKSTLIICGVVFLLFVIFEPFGINSSLGIYRWIILGGLLLVSALCTNLPELLLPFIFGKEYFEEKNWTVGRNIFYNILVLLMISIGNYLLISIFFSSYGFRFSTFLVVTTNTFLIGIFPVGLMTVLTENRNMSRHLKEVRSMNEHIHTQEEKAVSLSFSINQSWGKNVVLPDGLKGTWELKPERLLLAEADGNYVKIVYCQDDKLLQHSLRITMKQVEDAFSDYSFVQKCHRAFLVNLHSIEKVNGNSQGYRLMLKGWKEEIPVSRAYNKEIREKVLQS